MHIDPHSDGSALQVIPSSKTHQGRVGGLGWLSVDTMRRVGTWLVASDITEGPAFHRVGVDRRRRRAAVPPMAYETIPGHTGHWQEKLKGKMAEPARSLYRRHRVAQPAGRQRDLSPCGAERFQSGAGRDAIRQGGGSGAGAVEPFAARGTDTVSVCGRRGRVGIAQALLWSSPSTALRYGRKLAARNELAARILSRIRS
jgi:hypothetical protein